MAGSKAQQEFVSEAEEILERMRDDLSELAEARASGADPDPDLVNRLFRSAHSLKGLSGMFGLEPVSELSHHLEDVLDRLRMGRATLDAAGLALFDDAISTVATSLEKVGDAEQEEVSESRIAELTERIEQWVESEHAPEETPAQFDLSSSVLRALTEYEEHRLRENANRGFGIYLVDIDFEIASFEEGLAEISGAIREVGEVLSTLPSPGETPESQIRFSLLAATRLSLQELAERLELDATSIHTARPATAGEAAAESSDAPARVDERVEVAEEHDDELRAPGTGEERTLKSISDTVRVDIRKLDELMNLVGELAIQRGQVKAIVDRLAADPATARAALELGKVHKGLDRKLQDLQTGVLDVRMVPLRQVFDKLARVVRRLRIDLGKVAHLEVRGADTELDKLIVEELVDPLMHVVRNAFDHAIESPDERLAAGKPEAGRIAIEASQRGNDVVITVSDDGRGIDPDAVREQAVATGLVASSFELTRKECLDLLFLPGFSTRTEVTETSGRGVGMDVVRSNILSLGGIVEIESVPGAGTTLTITLPITLAIIQALIVGVADRRFAVPLNSVRETLIVDPREIQHSENRELLNLRGEPLPLRRLAEEFGIEAPEPVKQYAVVLGFGESRLGLLVDRLEGQQDTVIKPIQGPVRNVRGIAGATELGDQGAVLVLDTPALVEDGHRRREVS